MVAVDPERDDVAGDLPLERVGRALGHDPAVVDDREAVGERVGLLEVMRGQEDRGPQLAQVADLVPHARAGLRVQPGRRLVEEEHARAVDDAEPDVEAAAHAAGVGLGRAIGGRRQLERLEHLVGAGHRRRPCRGRTAGPGSRARRGRSRPGRSNRPAARSRSGDGPPGDRGRGRRRPPWRCPPVGLSSVASIRSVVVLPAPLGPRKPKISPASTVRSTPRTASTVDLRALKVRRRSSVSIIGPAGPVALFIICPLLWCPMLSAVTCAFSHCGSISAQCR